VEKGSGRLLLLSPLEIRIHNGAGLSAAVEIANEVGTDAILQKGGQGNVAEGLDGQTIRRECGGQDGGAQRRDNEVVIGMILVQYVMVNNMVFYY